MINSKNIKYKDIISKTLLKKTSKEIKIHPLENHFIIEINYDVIVELPSDENPVSDNETKIVNMLFKENAKNAKSKCKLGDFIDVLVVAGLFAIISLPHFDIFLRSIIVFNDENRAIYIILLLKTLLFAFLFWIIKYYGKMLW